MDEKPTESRLDRLLSESENGADSLENSRQIADVQNSPVIADHIEEIEPKNQLPFLIAAIGASAGGVEAYIDLVKHLPADTGMAFVILPHLLADQKSHLSEILARQTSIPTAEIIDETRPEPNRIYVLPANRRVRIDQGVLRLEDRPHDGIPRPIDFFFRSLAADQKNHAIGVVLSGTDADGALGLKAIRGEGGIAIVQSPESARFPEMPRSSISVDHVDIVLPPGQIASQLAHIGKQFGQPEVRRLEEGTTTGGEENHFARILVLLRGVSGVDFRLYKPNTIRRRIGRRMLLQRIDSLADYVVYLQGNPQEVRDLQEDSLINVTRFFRDPEVFDALKATILPRIFQSRTPDQQVRIWVAGCSSGEEVYSIAICLLEHLTGNMMEPPIQIFGTDASERNIEKARTGIYPESIASEISQERLRRFFIKNEKGYQVSKRVRDMCIFARQNLCHDPPFSKMDLISCRNVLIYFGSELQKQLIPTFHYALRSNGFLMLGTSETIREFTDLFGMLDRRHKIYERIGSISSRALLDVVPRVFLPEVAPAKLQTQSIETWSDAELQKAADRIVLSRYGPPGVVINDRLEILQSRGHTSPYLEMAQGAASLQLLRMVREGIAAQIGPAVRRAIEEDAPIQVQGLQVSDGDQKRIVTLEVLPINTVSSRSKAYLVLFAPAFQTFREIQPTDPTEFSDGGEDKDKLIWQMSHDLSSTKLYLQSLLEERDARNQELVSANEEIQSANEELQSTNEELETTKEELQSSNEELQTVNDELQNRNIVLTQASNDLSNLLNSVNLPVLMLGSDLNIRHFTPPTQRLMNLRSSDVGRPFGEIRMNLNLDDLEPIFNEVLETLGSREMEVQDREGRWYLLRVRPYRTTDNKIDGVVVVLMDIDQLRRSQQELRDARDFARSVIEGVHLPVAVIDLDFKIRFTNEAFCELTGSSTEDLERRSFLDLAFALWGMEDELRSRLTNLPANGENSIGFEHQTLGEARRVFYVRVRALRPDGENFLLVSVEDITAHKEAEQVLKVEGERLTIEVASTAKELNRTQDDLRALTSNLFISQEEERRRVARELHDDICQQLAALEIDIQHIEQHLSTASSGVQNFQKIRERLGSLSEDVHRISRRLRPSIIDDLGLQAALQALVEDFRDREQMITTFSARKVPGDIDPEVAIGLYRISQEALRNVSRHAGRTHVKVFLSGTAKGLQLQIADSGNGFSLESPRLGLGLIGMEERARLIGGTMKIASAPGDGTKVTVQVPIHHVEKPH